MNTLVVYFSQYGNTQKIAEAVAEVMRAQGTARTLPLDRITPADLNGADLVVMGCPTYRMNLPEPVRSAFETLPRRVLAKIPIAAFDTSYKMNRWLAAMTAARKLSGKLRRLGGKQIVPPETFYVNGHEGPLYDGEVERAKQWAETIRQRAAAHKA